MATVELQPMTDNLLKLDPAPLNLENSPMKLDPTPLNLESPLNHASAVIEELVAESKSEHVSLKVIWADHCRNSDAVSIFGWRTMPPDTMTLTLTLKTPH